MAASGRPLVLRKVLDIPVPLQQLPLFKQQFSEHHQAWNDSVRAEEPTRLEYGTIDSRCQQFFLPLEELPKVLRNAGECVELSDEGFACVTQLIAKEAVSDAEFQSSEYCSFRRFVQWIPTFLLAAQIEAGEASPQEVVQPVLSGDAIRAMGMPQTQQDGDAPAEEANPEENATTGENGTIPGAVRFAKQKAPNKKVPVAKIWTILQEKLPTDKSDPEHKKRRKEMFNGFDPNGNGYLSLAETQKGIRDVLKIDELFDCKPVIMRAFQAAKGCGNQNTEAGALGHDYVERREFRKLLLYIRQYFEVWHMFDAVDSSDDRRIDETEFLLAATQLEAWGVAPKSQDELKKEFTKIDKNGGGIVLFDEFAEWAIRLSLDLEDDDD